MKKIAFVIATLSNGGAERAVSNIVTHLPKEYEADIVLNDTAVISYPYKGNLISLNVKPQKNKISLWYQGKVLYKRWNILRKLKKEKRYKAVLSFSDSANIANVLSGKKNCKCIISVRNNLSKCQDVWVYKYIVSPLVKLLYHRADKIVTVSEGVRQDLIKNFRLNPSMVTTIYNGIDRGVIEKRLHNKDSIPFPSFPNTQYTLVTIGRLVDQKGQWHLIRSLTILMKRKLNFKLLILGEGPLKSYLSSLSQEMGLADRVLFCGFCNNPFKYLKEADIGVFPSMYEGFANTLLEAMCCGVPCISTDCDSGPREMLAPDTDLTYKNRDQIEYAQYGVIVPVCDGHQYKAAEPLTKEETLLGEAICELLLDVQKRQEYIIRQRQRVGQFDMEQIVKAWVNVIESGK